MNILQNTKDVINVNKLYGKECTLPVKNFIDEYKVNENGLSDSEVEERQKNFGRNELKQARQKKWYNYFTQSLFSPFNSILLGIVLILLYTDVFLPEKPSFANIIVIITLVLVSTVLEFTEEYKSNKAVAKLKELVETTGVVMRNGEKVEVPFKDITVRRYCYIICRKYDSS